jgi:hypothetical protein
MTNFVDELSNGAENNDRGQQNNIGLISDLSYFDDTMLDSELATSGNVLAWMPGSFQMLEWFKNVGDFRMVGEQRGHIRDVITLNIGGIVVAFDIYMTENFCDDDTSGLTVTLKKEWDVWNFPSDIFESGDDLFGTNGCLGFAITAA